MTSRCNTPRGSPFYCEGGALKSNLQCATQCQECFARWHPAVAQSVNFDNSPGGFQDIMDEAREHTDKCSATNYAPLLCPRCGVPEGGLCKDWDERTMECNHRRTLSESGQTNAAPQASGAKTVSREAAPAVAAPYVPSAAPVNTEQDTYLGALITAYGDACYDQGAWPGMVVEDYEKLGDEVYEAKRKLLAEIARVRSSAPSSEAVAYKEFWTKHALGSMLCPSCLLCGQQRQREEWAITHAELPDIYICKTCVEAARRTAPAGGVALADEIEKRASVKANRTDRTVPNDAK